MNNTKMTSMELRAIWVLGTVLSLRMLGIFMVLPVLTTYGMALRNASESLIGLAIGVYGLAQAILQIPFGLASDCIGRKPIIIGGLLIFALGSAIAAITDNIWGMILGRALQGSGAIAAAVMALLSDLTSEQNRTKVIALIGISFGVIFAIAMVISPIVTHIIGLNGLFWSITALALISIVLIILVVPTVDNYTLNGKSGIVCSSISKVLANPQLLKLNMGIFCLHAILMLNFVALPPMMIGAGFLPSEQWKVYMITMLISFATVVPVITYAEVKCHMKRVFLSCVTMLLFAELILFAASKHLWVIFAGIQLFFLAFNIMEALLPSLISKKSPVGYKGTVMGIYSTSQFLGVSFGGTLGGFLFQFYGAWLVFLVGAIIALVWWVMSTMMHESLYISSLRIALPNDRTVIDDQLAQHLHTHPNITEVVVSEECSCQVLEKTEIEYGGSQQSFTAQEQHCDRHQCNTNQEN